LTVLGSVDLVNERVRSSRVLSCLVSWLVSCWFGSSFYLWLLCPRGFGGIRSCLEHDLCDLDLCVSLSVSPALLVLRFVDCVVSVVLRLRFRLAFWVLLLDRVPVVCVELS
jgi:hypothetical protein